MFQVSRIFCSFALLALVSLSCCGCGGSAENSVINPTDNFQEDASVAAEKAKMVEQSRDEPL